MFKVQLGCLLAHYGSTNSQTPAFFFSILYLSSGRKICGFLPFLRLYILSILSKTMLALFQKKKKPMLADAMTLYSVSPFNQDGVYHAFKEKNM